MTTSNTKKGRINAAVKQYILYCIDTENYGVIATNDKDKLNFLYETFKTEFVYESNVIRYGGNRVKMLSEWFMGLPSSFNIDFENYKILEIAKSWGCIPTKATEKQEDKIIENWFLWIANKTFLLIESNRVDTALRNVKK